MEKKEELETITSGERRKEEDGIRREDELRKEEIRLKEEILLNEQKLKIEREHQDKLRKEEQIKEENRRNNEELRRRELKDQEEQKKEEKPENKQEQEQNDDRIPQSQELRDLANTHDKYVGLVKSGYYDEKRQLQREEKECKQVIQKYDTLRAQVEQLDKVNRNIDTIKDKNVLEKYKVTKKELEDKISHTLDIEKEKSSFFQTKSKLKQQENKFNEKIHQGLEKLGKKADIANNDLKQMKAERNNIKHIDSEHEVERSDTRSQSKMQVSKVRNR